MRRVCIEGDRGQSKRIEFTQPRNFLDAKVVGVRLLEKDALAVHDEHNFIVAVRLNLTQMLDQFDGLGPT